MLLLEVVDAMLLITVFASPFEFLKFMSDSNRINTVSRSSQHYCTLARLVTNASECSIRIIAATAVGIVHLSRFLLSSPPLWEIIIFVEILRFVSNSKHMPTMTTCALC